ncbi:MAG: DUF4169 family protein [Hyphomicrobiaceae bacterium]
MSDVVVNLGKVRKARARAEREAQASANRSKFGRTKAEVQRAKNADARREKLLDQTRRDSGDREP